MIVTGVKDTYRCLASELQTEFTGDPKNNFVWWVVAIGGVGALGYVPVLRPFSKAFLTLVIIVIILAQSKNGGGGFFGELQAALQKGPDKIDPAQCAAPASGAASAPTKVDTGNKTVDNALGGLLNGTGTQNNNTGTPEGNAVGWIFNKVGLPLPDWLQKSL